jgi:hypothetical protein
MKVEQFYQEVKNEYKGNGISFENYNDAFKFAEAYHRHRVNEITDEEIDKMIGHWESVQTDSAKLGITLFKNKLLK